MEKSHKAVGHEKFWVCDRSTCAYKVLVVDATGKAFRKEPARCPSCGKKPDTPAQKIAATRDPR